MTGVTFGAWTFPGNPVTSVNWAITTMPGVFPKGSAAAVTTEDLIGPAFGCYPVNQDGFSTVNASLAVGT